jgi:WD40 repeat protein
MARAEVMTQNPKRNIMDAPTKHKSLATMPSRKIKVNNRIGHVLHLPGGKRIIIYSWDGSFRNWDLETGTQVGEEWKDKDFGLIMALSPDGKKVASGSPDGAVKLWNIDTGKIIKTLTGHTTEVRCVCWSSDGGQVASGCQNGTFRAWDVEDGKTILGPIKAVEPHMQWAICYSPDAKMIATGGNGLKIWDANNGESLKSFEGVFMCLVWNPDGKTLFAGGSSGITKIDTATWMALDLCENIANTISLSPNERILASTSFVDKTAQLWNLDTNQPIGTPLHHQGSVGSATFSVDGKFLVTGCRDDHIYTWDISAIIKKAGLPSDIVSIDLFYFRGH